MLLIVSRFNPMTSRIVFLQKNSLSMMLYLADNLAYIPFSHLDEPLYVIHHIDIQISVSGSNLLQTFKEVSCYQKRASSI